MTEIDETIEALRRAGFDCPDESLARLAASARRTSLPNGDYLFHKGDPSRSLFVVVSGQLDAVSTSYEGQDLVFSRLGPDTVIGELTVIDGSPRTASIRAASAATVISFDRQAFLETARADGAVGLALAALCARAAHRLSGWAEGASFSDTSVRLVRLLLEIAPDDATGPVTIRATQQSLADQLGLTRESVNKALNNLAHDEFVALGRGTVTINDVDAASMLLI
ncbi:MAG: Crp/Fnr family transcriptional regulator [Actinomycetota bacterium]